MIQNQHQFIFLSLVTGVVQVEFVASLTLKDGGEERGTEREIGIGQRESILRKVQIGLVCTEWYEGRAPRTQKVWWMAHLCWVHPFQKENDDYR